MGQMHRELVVWQDGMALARQVYALTRSFPRAEQFGLISQLTRAAVSVPANIAEGNARGTRKDYAHFVAIARGSLAELDTLLELSAQLGFLTSEDHAKVNPTLERLAKMLNALHRKLCTPLSPS